MRVRKGAYKLMMKKGIWKKLLVAVSITCMISGTAFAKGNSGTVAGNGGSQEIGVYAKSEYNAEDEYTAAIEKGKASVQAGKEITVTVTDAPDAAKQLVVVPIPSSEKEAWKWIEASVNKTAKAAHVFDMYFTDANGKRIDADGAVVTIACKHCEKSMIVCSLDTDGTVEIMKSTEKDASVTFTTDGSSYYVLAEKKSTPSQPNIKEDANKSGWEMIKDEISDAKEKETVTVEMNGAAVVPKEVFETVKGKDTKVVFDMGNGVTWTVNGKDIDGKELKDINFSVIVGKEAGESIPEDILKEAVGEKEAVNLTLVYDGEFGFAATLTINVGQKYAGQYANLYYYNPETKALEFTNTSLVDKDGNVSFEFTHASDYTIIMDKAKADSSDTSTDKPSDETGSNHTQNTTKTGDSSMVWMNVAIMAGAVAVIGVVLTRKNFSK